MSHFPHPEDMQKNLADHGRKLVTIIDPHIKQDSNYPVQVEGQKRGCFVKDKSGEKDFDGWVQWPEHGLKAGHLLCLICRVG